ncbi:oligopeptidase B [Leifsonia xyli subsp. cynodontis DSM 46306]|jgi:anti-sigma factor RsiW|uniref:Putative zinc-finger domain-containing protein n=1 Tax=Leifsonia xyli subsp. cynodontis DSM 46306 TaxID=1389489 RepID=U3P9R6_LEIXC|nr:zf-HC2 domain-containing protein [Leifsonia xyli]AGW41602.1 oligopeptidase B [Leifsonia xyli subsp. cynodontis DSM 46306]
MTDDDIAAWDAAYVLGALAPAERRAFEEHLSRCLPCAAAVAELAGMPGLLARLPREQAFELVGTTHPALGRSFVSGAAASALASAAREGDPAASGDDGRAVARDAWPASADVPPVGADVFPSLLRAARRRRVRARLLLGVIATAAAAALAGVLVVALPFLFPSSSPSPERRVAMEKVVPSTLSADLVLTREPWGTRIDSRCRYARPPGGDGRTWTYSMVVTDRAGRETPVSTWTARQGTTATPTATTSVPLAEIASIDIRAADGPIVLLRSTIG